MGINIPTREELIANAKDFEDIALKVGKFPKKFSCKSF